MITASNSTLPMFKQAEECIHSNCVEMALFALSVENLPFSGQADIAMGADRNIGLPLKLTSCLFPLRSFPRVSDM